MSIISNAKFWALATALTASTAAQAWDLGFKADVLGGALNQDIVSDSVYNPGNRALFLSENSAFVELRPQASLDFDESFHIMFRPRARTTLQQPPQANITDAWINEAYVTAKPFSGLEFSVGRQNFQWGPAELFSPSNMFFPQALYFVSPFYEIRGVTMARANVGFGSHWSWITLAELNPLNDASFAEPEVLRETSEQRLETKVEVNWNNGAHVLGLTAGTQNPNGVSQNAAGGYGSFTIDDSLQLYFDSLDLAQQQQGPKVVTLVGARYTFSDGTEIRLEGVQNDLGENADELQVDRQLLASGAATLAPSAIADSNLPGRKYAYLSIRHSSQAVVANWFHQPTASLRGLESLTDGSAFLMLALESGLSDHFTGYFYGGAALGAKDSELRRALNHALGIALRASF